MTVSVKIEGAEQLLRALRELPAEFVDKGGRAVRAGVRTAAKVVQTEVVANLDQIIAEPNVGGKDESTGLLRESIKVSKRRVPSGESYAVRVSNKRYPEEPGAESSPPTTAQVARLLEYGTEATPPKSFIRRAFEAKKEEAARVMVEDAQKRIDRIWKRAR